MRWLLGLVLLAFGVAAALPSAIRLGLADIPGPADRDLALIDPAPIPEPNAFDALMRAAQALPSGEPLDAIIREQLGKAPFETEAASALIAEYSEVLSHFDRALAAPGFRTPDATWDEDLPNVQAWFTAARLHALDVRVRFERASTEGSGPDVLRLLELGRRVQADPSATWLHWIAGAELKEIGLRTLIAATATWRPTAGVSHAWSRTLSEFTTRSDDLHTAWAGEYRAARSALLASAPPSGSSYSFQPNRTLALQASHTRSLQARAGRRCAELEPELHSVDSRSPAMLFLRGLRPNAVGEILAEVARPSGNRFALRRCAADTLLAATQLTIALAAASSETGRLPERLSDLVPTYIAAIPTSAYDGTALKLDGQGRRLATNGSALPEARATQQSPDFPLPF